MSIDRRSALVLIGAAAWAAKGEALSVESVAGSTWFVDDQNDASDVLKQLGKHVYSEDGVPMFLACENVTGPVSQEPDDTALPLDVNKRISAAFEHYAGEWQQQHPRASAGDVAKIVEVLAAHDFAAGGKEASL